MILKKPTKKQFEALCGSLTEQVKAVMSLAFEDDGSPVFVDIKTASYKRFSQVIEAIKDQLKTDVEAKTFLTAGLARMDITVGEVEKLFTIEEADKRFEQLLNIVKSKLRLDGKKLSNKEYENLPYADQLIAVNSATREITGEGLDPLPESVKA